MSVATGPRAALALRLERGMTPRVFDDPRAALLWFPNASVAARSPGRERAARRRIKIIWIP